MKKITQWACVLLAVAAAGHAGVRDVFATPAPVAWMQNEEGTALVVDVQVAGTLSSLVTDTGAESLTLTGNLNGSDFDFIQQRMTALRTLDLKGVQVEGNAIPNYALQGHKGLQKVVLPEGLKTIGYQAFDQCSALAEVVWPEGLVTIEQEGFSECSLTGELTLPASVESIGTYAFDYSPITKATVPARTLGEYVFKECRSLQSVVFTGDTVAIGQYEFQNCSALSSVEFQGYVETVDYRAFYECPTLQAADFTGGVGTVGEDAFYRCGALARVSFPLGVNSIGREAFRECPVLSEVSFTGHATSIGEYAFYECGALAEVAFPDSVGSIGNLAFYRCSALREVVFPGTVGSMGTQVFEDCTALQKVVFPDNLAQVSDYTFCYCRALQEVALPQTLSRIGEYAFYDCERLEDFTMPDSLKSIGNYAFNECYRLNKVAVKAATPPTMGSNVFNYTRVAFVPKGSGALYSAASGWSGMVVIDGDTPLRVEVELGSAGTLGEEILKQVDYVNVVNELVVSGPLNSDDYYQIQQRMPNLMSIDMTGVLMEELPNYFFDNRGTLLSIKLPQGLKRIGSYAFNRCYGLTEMELPEGLEQIRYSAFENCYALKRINLPSTLTSMESSVFSYCYSLETLAFPDGLRTIESSLCYNCSSLSSVTLPAGLYEVKSSAFRGCGALSEVVFPDGLTRLEDEAFRYCYGFSEVLLPASLEYCGRAFRDCSNIKEVVSLASIPPSLNGTDDILYGVGKGDVQLYVPFWSVNDYKLTRGWDAFPNINAAEGYEADEINVHGSLTLAEGMRPTNEPAVRVHGSGQLTVDGPEAFSMRRYTQSHRLDMRNSSNHDRSTYTRLISESETMRADTVEMEFSVNYANAWMFISFPFDVQVADIEVSDGAQYAIRKYDGASRAQGETANWRDMTADSTLRAGEGYILQLSKTASRFAVQAVNNGQKNRLFSGTAITTPLGEHLSEFAHNRSWNFVGNPYPCYFDVHYLEYSSPITVWNGQGYTAYSPTDDDYILRPMQAFFVQKPVETDALTFLPEGRQMDASVRPRPEAVPAAQDEMRYIYNVYMDGTDYTDRTRVVVNEAAGAGYDLLCDAAKFMSSREDVPQLYVIGAEGSRYAIDERPLGTGVVRLGVHVGRAGSYTLRMDSGVGEVWLKDKAEGREVRLDGSSYTFGSEPGDFDNRFELRLRTQATGLESVGATDGVRVQAGQGCIEVLGTEAGARVTVCNVAGRVVNETTATQATTRIQAGAGLYLVTVEGETHKVVVKD